MKNLKEKDCSAAWWAEIEEIEEKRKDLDWCCKLIVQNGFDDFIHSEVGTYVSLRFGVNYCPHCGKTLKKVTSPVQTRACCYLFRDLGLEGMQYEEPSMKGNGETEIVVHRLIMKHCFNCGREINWESGDDPNGWAGEDGCNGECDECI